MKSMLQTMGRVFQRLRDGVQSWSYWARGTLALVSFVVVFALVDGMYIAWHYWRLQQAAQAAVEFATQMQPVQEHHLDGSVCGLSESCYEETEAEYQERRAALIKAVALTQLTGQVLAEDRLASLAQQAAAYNVEVWGFPSYEELPQRDHPGLAGLPVEVRVRQTLGEVSLLLGVLCPDVELKAVVDRVNEGIQVGFGNAPPPSFTAPGVTAARGAVGEGLLARSYVGREQYLLKEAALKLDVQDTEVAVRSVERIAQDQGGYVVQQRVGYDELRLVGHIAIAVPQKNLEPALVELRQLAVVVRNETLSVRDVSEEYINLEARLRNQQATQDRVVELLAMAETVEEALLVSQELSAIEEQIEQLQGQLNHLHNQVVFSLITIDLVPEGHVATAPSAWNVRGVAARAVGALLSILQGLVGLGIWLGIVGLPLFVLGYVLWGSVKVVGTRLLGKKSRGSEPEPAKPLVEG